MAGVRNKKRRVASGEWRDGDHPPLLTPPGSTRHSPLATRLYQEPSKWLA